MGRRRQRVGDKEDKETRRRGDGDSGLLVYAAVIYES
jgi:hypothetical protein